MADRPDVNALVEEARSASLSGSRTHDELTDRLADTLEAVEAERARLKQAVERFVKYADEYPEDIQGPLAEDFLPQLRSLAGEANDPS